MDLENTVTLAVGLLIAFKLDTLSDFIARKLYDKYTRKSCEMICARPAEGTFIREGKEIDLCHTCMQESIHGAMQDAMRRAQDEFDAGHDF